jgi:hypothetical protein
MYVYISPIHEQEITRSMHPWPFGMHISRFASLKFLFACISMWMPLINNMRVFFGGKIVYCVHLQKKKIELLLVVLAGVWCGWVGGSV